MTLKDSTKEAKYPIYAKCSQYTLDDYWKDVLYNCSLGKFPPKMSMVDKETIKITNSKKSFEMFDVTDDPLEMFKLVMDIFKNKLDMKSDRDRKIKIEKFNTKNLDKAVYSRWEEVKQKVVKDKLINDFVLMKRDEYTLTDAECDSCMKVIKSGLLFKVIKSENIVLKDSSISDIGNLKFDETSRSFEVIGVIEAKKKIATVSATHVNPLIKEVEKYVERHKTFVKDF